MSRTKTIEDERPEFVTCIVHEVGEGVFYRRALCGRDVLFEFYFVSVGHAMRERLRHGRLLVCHRCADVVHAVLTR